MNRFSTRTHGLLDYLSVVTLIVLPRLLGWNSKVTNLLTGLAAGTLGYSALTRYEWGLLKVIPVRGHLLLDAMSGIFLIMAPKLFGIRNPLYRAALVTFGLFEVSAASMTEIPEELASPQAPEFLVPMDVDSYVNS